MERTRVVVTGLGVVSPVGNSAEQAWETVLAGRSGISRIDEFDTSAYSVHIGGVVRDFDITEYLSAKEARKMDPFIHFAIGASAQALADSGLDLDGIDRDRVGVSVGSGIGGILSIETSNAVLLNSGPRKVSPFLVPSSVINMAAGNISIHYDLRGPNVALVTACTTGAHSIGMAARMIAAGDADVMVAGGTEKCITPLGLAGFCAARALSTRNDDPLRASRPWDQDRDGFVLSEGAGIVVLESYEHARRRGAEIYAELAGYGMSADAHHITQPRKDGDGARRCMERALEDAGLTPDGIDYINAHGTSTQVGDIAEAEAVRRMFREYSSRVALSSTKSMTGHLLGAAGGLEAVFSVLAIRDGVAPPTINLEKPEPSCAELNLVAGEAQARPIRAVLSNSFGFGGTNGSLVFRCMD